jgi:hypothetical protein
MVSGSASHSCTLDPGERDEAADPAELAIWSAVHEAFVADMHLTVAMAR